MAVEHCTGSADGGPGEVRRKGIQIMNLLRRLMGLVLRSPHTPSSAEKPEHDVNSGLEKPDCKETDRDRRNVIVTGAAALGAASPVALVQPSSAPLKVREGGVGSVPLEQQLSNLAELGLKADEGITISDFLYSFSREEFEQSPYDLVLFVLGVEVEREPWGRYFSSCLWNFDTECIEGKGDYQRILQRLCTLTADPKRLTDVEDHVDIEGGVASVRYRVDGELRQREAVINNDWADIEVVHGAMRDIERDGHKFFGKDNGQAIVLTYLSPAVADQLNRLIGRPELKFEALLD